MIPSIEKFCPSRLVRPRFAAAILLLSASVALAQSAAPVATGGEDKLLKFLNETQGAKSISGGIAQPNKSLATSPKDEAVLKEKIAQLRQIGERKPGTKEARDASVEEFHTLAKLAQHQDPALEQRRHVLAERLKKDEALPRKERAMIDSLSANLDVSSNRSLEPDQRMDGFAKAAWQNLKEFPEHTENYAALLRVARDSNDQQAKKIAEDLLASAAAPEIKQEAQNVLNRLALVGKKLKALVGQEAQWPKVEGPLCLFTWTASQPGSLNLAKMLGQLVPSGTTLVAICLDRDIAAAKAFASQQNLSVTWVYPTSGKESLLCQKLLLSGPAVYMTDSQGRITTIGGLNQLTKMRWKKAKEAKS